MPRNALAVVMLSALWSLTVLASAGAAPMWLAPATLSSTGQSAQAPQVSVDARGDALAVWQRTTVIEASSRPAGSGAWQAPVTISSAADEASLPQVALDSAGDAVVVWLSYDGSEYSIDTASRAGLSGSWQPSVTLRKLGAMTVAEPRADLAADAQGDAVAVWRRMEGGEVLVEGDSRPTGGVWQEPETISKDAENLHPAEVGIDAAGDATAVWEAKGAEVRIDASSKPASGKWQAPVALSAPGANANEPRVAVDPRGDAVAVWERFEGEELIEAASRPAASGAWAKPVALTGPEGGKGEPANQQVAIDGAGDAVAVWSRANAATHDVVEASVGSTSSSVWRPAVSLSAPGASVEERPQVAANAQGNAVVVWERSNGANEIVEAAAGLATSGAWQAPVLLSGAGQSASEQQVALDAQGNAAALWSRFDGTSYVAQAAGYDAAGPQLSSLAIPTTGTVGQALAFSASPLDVWSPLGTTSWSFGDGTSQAGASVTHAYGTPGRYTVTVAATDVLGNTAGTSATVLIAAAKPQPPTVGAVAPRISGARLSHRRLRVARRATAIAANAKAPLGTSFHFTLSETAALRIAFERSAVGLRSGGRCVAPSARLRRRHAKRCARALLVGTLTRASELQGADSLAFSGRIASRALPPGSYTAVLTAREDGLTSSPVKLALSIVR